MYSDHYRQVPLYMTLLDQGRLAAVDRRRPYTVTTINRRPSAQHMYINIHNTVYIYIYIYIYIYMCRCIYIGVCFTAYIYTIIH